MAPEKNAAGGSLPHGGDGCFKSLLIAVSTAAGWRPMWTRLAEWEIAAQNDPSGVAERVRESDQKRRIAVGPGAMGQNQAVTRGINWEMQEAADWGFA